MGRVIRLTESQLKSVIKKVIQQQSKRLNEWDDHEIGHGQEDFDVDSEYLNGNESPHYSDYSQREDVGRNTPDPENRIGDNVNFILNNRKYQGEITSVGGFDGDHYLFIISFIDEHGTPKKAEIAQEFIFME